MTPVKVRAIIHHMMGDNVNPFPILVLLNYWELRPTQIGAKLDELLKREVTQFAAFVPWQLVEADISHSLTRFLQAVLDRRMHVFLILSPELGIHYPCSGLPKDVASRKENAAQHSHAGGIAVLLPPNNLNLPSYFAPEFMKRYQSYLHRMDGYFSDLSRLSPSLPHYVTLVLSGSFWKYYRSPVLESQSFFSEMAGDYSSHASVLYRQKVDAFYSQREFSEPTPVTANRWKVRSFEEVNRRWFYQSSETDFRNRTCQMIRRRAGFPVIETEIYTPEADPAFFYARFLQMMDGGSVDVVQLSKYLEAAATRASFGALGPNSPWVHWTVMGGFPLLSEAEKQFLILKSVLLMGGYGGGLFLDEGEWANLSSQFKNRVQTLANSLNEGELELTHRVLYLTPHLWSLKNPMWDELCRRIGVGVRVISDLEMMVREQNATLLFIDPSYIVTRDVLRKLTAWTRAGRIVVLSKTPLYTEVAQQELDHVLSQTKGIQIDMGIPYRLHGLDEGKLVVYEIPEGFSRKGETLSIWQNFLNSILSFAEVDGFCKLSDARLSVIPFEQEDGNLALFVLNGTRTPVTATLTFGQEVWVHDLGSILSGMPQERNVEMTKKASQFSLEVPPFGVMPLMVEGLGLVEAREKHLASKVAAETRESASKAADTELPGLDSEDHFGEPWN